MHSDAHAPTTSHVFSDIFCLPKEESK